MNVDNVGGNTNWENSCFKKQSKAVLCPWAFSPWWDAYPAWIYLSENTSFFWWLTWKVIKRVNSLCAFCECHVIDVFTFTPHTFLMFVTFTPLNLMRVDASLNSTNCDRLFPPLPFTNFLSEVPITKTIHRWTPRPESRIESHPLVRSHSNEKLRTKYRAGPKERRQSDTGIAQNKIGIVRWTTHIAGDMIKCSRFYLVLFVTDVETGATHIWWDINTVKDCQCATYYDLSIHWLSEKVFSTFLYQIVVK